jgi:hypothetical protein
MQSCDKPDERFVSWDSTVNEDVDAVMPIVDVSSSHRLANLERQVLEIKKYITALQATVNNLTQMAEELKTAKP